MLKLGDLACCQYNHWKNLGKNELVMILGILKGDTIFFGNHYKVYDYNQQKILKVHDTNMHHFKKFEHEG